MAVIAFFGVFGALAALIALLGPEEGMKGPRDAEGKSGFWGKSTQTRKSMEFLRKSFRFLMKIGGFPRKSKELLSKSTDFLNEIEGFQKKIIRFLKKNKGFRE